MFVRQLPKLPRLAHLPPGSASTYSSAAAATAETLPPRVQPNEFRTAEDQAARHSSLHAAKFYTLPPDQKKQLFGGGGLPKSFEVQAKTFAETCLMVRQPALEVLHYLRHTDFSRPAVRYVLYGETGTGKTLSLAHILHYGHQNQFVLVHVPWVPNWMKRPKETSQHEQRDGFVDLPFDAAAWLVHFKAQNGKLLQRLALTTSKEYTWSKRETTPAGATLLELVEHGIQRIKFASDTVAVLLQELKDAASGGRCKVMVAIDGFNAFFHPETRIFGENKQRITPDRLTLTAPFLNITGHDWTNGVCVLTVDKIAMTEGHMESPLPRYLLGPEGFEHLDPCVPVRVDNYTDKEFASCLSYYVERNWVQKRPDDYADQLRHLSNQHPYTLMRLTRSL